VTKVAPDLIHTREDACYDRCSQYDVDSWIHAHASQLGEETGDITHHLTRTSADWWDGPPTFRAAVGYGDLKNNIQRPLLSQSSHEL
jgi:hypothetical protein